MGCVAIICFAAAVACLIFGVWMGAIAFALVGFLSWAMADK
jgi:hypothetical protein